MHYKEFKALCSTLYPQIYSGARDGSVVSAKLDLRVYHPCKVKYCDAFFYNLCHLQH